MGSDPIENSISDNIDFFHMDALLSAVALKVNCDLQLTLMANSLYRMLGSRIVDSFFFWVGQVEKVGLEETRKRPGVHDEPLKGDREGQRSVRLNRAYRAIYRIVESGVLKLVRVEEVNKHDY